MQTESERQIDKLRRKEGKKQRRGTDQGNDNELSSMSFSSLIQASEKRSIFDDLIGTGGESNATALPQGTVKKHYKGYEEVTIPPTQTAPMKPGEKLVTYHLRRSLYYVCHLTRVTQTWARESDTGNTKFYSTNNLLR